MTENMAHLGRTELTQVSNDTVSKTVKEWLFVI